MRLSELFEAKPAKKAVVPSTSDLQKSNNPIAVAHQKRSGNGSGSHTKKEFTRKEKHKSDPSKS